MMQPAHHPLIDEFPEYREEIHNLKSENTHFRNLAHEYEKIDKAIVRAEQGIETVSDDYLEAIKKQRLHLKDQIYSMLKTS